MMNIEYVYEKYFPKAFTSYDEARAFVLGGRSPVYNGRRFTATFRLFYDEQSGCVAVRIGDTEVAVFCPDNTVKFTATQGQAVRYGMELTGNIHKVIPVYVRRIAKGRYSVMCADDILKAIGECRAPRNRWHRAALAAIDKQEYFQHLRLDLKTGKIVNPKDMSPIVNDEKRNEWRARLKYTRLKLRAMARVGALEPYGGSSSYTYLGTERIRRIAECIMQGGLDTEAIEYIASAIPAWKYRQYSSAGEAILALFEAMVKSNSRDMQSHVGVIDIPK